MGICRKQSYIFLSLELKNAQVSSTSIQNGWFWSIEVNANASHPMINKNVTMSDPVAFGTGDGPATTSSNPSTDLAATTYSMICLDISF